MMTMAVAVGNAIVWKPSEKVPSAALEFARLWKEAGLPDGVFNVVQGDKEVVDAILEHPGIAGVSFVGSTTVGEYIYQKGTSHNKRVAAFTGGKNHMVVLPTPTWKLRQVPLFLPVLGRRASGVWRSRFSFPWAMKRLNACGISSFRRSWR